ncbi:hypothetical protein FA95DRAFT_1569801 [Auriscalpium vulgare]|uniref:Uncharacterized protein n=1 Tax=Auriscalpium vulgare TaxID=40419 RepID=A0ACB8S748_9AGAM|nr:hypothetical protein FA95DRAFT_1569801 [Auriscalpium vulgare]
MPALPSRDDLESMKRVDLQRLCKEHGIKANLKSEALIDLLLDTPRLVHSIPLPRASFSSPFSDQTSPPPPPSPQPPPRTSSMRIISRVSTSRSRLQSTGSMVIHSDDEDNPEDAPVPSPPTAPAGPATRTRKAKDTQLRLGVGRPMAAGGTGARAVTKSVSAGKGRRGKSSRSLRPTEDTIPEEAAPQMALLIAGPSNLTRQSTQSTVTGQLPSPPPADMPSTRDAIQALVREHTLPLQQTIQSLQVELRQRTIAQDNEINVLKTTVNEMRAELRDFRQQSEAIQVLRTSVERLQTELERARRSGSLEPSREPMNLSTPVSIPTNSPPHPGDSSLATFEPIRSRQPPGHAESSRFARSSRTSPAFEYPPPPARSPVKNLYNSATALGKRQRASGASDDTGIVDAGQEAEMSEGELGRTIVRPSRKRAKTEQDSGDELERVRTLQVPVPGPSTPPPPPQFLQGSSRGGDDSLMGAFPVARPGFHVFAGPEELSRTHDPLLPSGDDDIFTDHDFDFFDSAAPLHAIGSREGGPQTSTAHASENQPFTFAFPGVSRLPITSTPAGSGALATPGSPRLTSFPYPEEPHSPSPAPTHRIDRGVGRLERPYGAPDSRNLSGSSSVPTHDSAVSPAALLRTPPTGFTTLGRDHDDGRRKASSNDVGAGLGMIGMPSRIGDTPAAPVRRTMYGTELEGDTRFGDFGVEGVATGFWSGTRY